MSKLDKARTIEHNLGTGRHAWLQVLRGTVELNGLVLNTGDGAAISDERTLQIHATRSAEIMLFDLA